MKAGWRRQQLRDVCDLINGRAYRKPELLVEGKYPVLRVGNFFTNDQWYYSDLELDEKKYCDSGDLLYAWSASFGPRIWNGGKVIFHYHIWKVVPDVNLIDQKFLFYYFLWDVEKIKQDSGAGTTMLHVSKGSMENRGIDFPSLPEQQRIVDVLDEAFDGISTAKTNAEKNLQNARGLFESHLQSVFTEECDGWTQKPLGEMATFRNGINFTKTSKGEPIKILGVKDFQKNYWAPLEAFDSIIPDGVVPEADTLKKNDIVFVRSNGNPELIGRCLLVGDVTEKTTHSGFTIKARLHSDEVSPTYLCHFLKSGKTRRTMIDGGNGANIRSLNQGTLSRIPVPYPSQNEQMRIVARLEDIQSETEHLESVYRQKLNALEELKKSLLHQAFSGQL